MKINHKLQVANSDLLQQVVQFTEDMHYYSNKANVQSLAENPNFSQNLGYTRFLQQMRSNNEGIKLKNKDLQRRLSLFKELYDELRQSYDTLKGKARTYLEDMDNMAMNMKKEQEAHSQLRYEADKLQRQLTDAEEQIAGLLDSKSEWSARHFLLLSEYKKENSFDLVKLKQEVERYKADLEKAIREKDKLEKGFLLLY
ncbi:hypothetical protein BDB01DRAFT_852764 [Pilobolus umbonatus]|nr:hypothetical protein BDB01DRAFT_852764 [Pilobolus umbonatus]